MAVGFMLYIFLFRPAQWEALLYTPARSNVLGHFFIIVSEFFNADSHPCHLGFERVLSGQGM